MVVVRGLNPGPFTGPGTNTCLIGTGPRPILLDTGSGVDGYIPLLEAALRSECDTDAPGDVVVTHVHPDHIGGAADVGISVGVKGTVSARWVTNSTAPGSSP